MIRAAAVSCLFFLLVSPAAAQWRSMPVVDDLTGQRTLVALVDGVYGQMRMLVDCREGFYVLAFGFTGDAVLADGSVVLEWGGDGLVERQHWSLDDDREVAYVTTWPGDAAAGVRYDPQALGFFDNLRRHPYLRVWATQYPDATVGDQFPLAGAGRALDALNCPHR
jgi:hypothetical protein